MTQPIRPRRSMLYVPGDKPRALEKAKTLACDAIIFDLEDAVGPENKSRARAAIAEAVRAGGYATRELILRVSAPDNADDLVLAAALPIHGVLLPKVEAPATVTTVARTCPHPIWCMIETPLGVLRAGEIAAASDRLAGFVAGTNDLTKDLRARHTPDRAPLLTALSLMVLAARAYRLAVIDGVHLDLDDLAGFEAACRQGVELGFDGKSLVHPNSIDIANRIFGPAPDEIAQARRIVAGWAEARAQGLGVTRIDGAMVEQLHFDAAERLLALADVIART
ncbi:HpcH/HpaI aldolase/citrate lyase family protein [Sphingomonas sp. BAUL-RG-20F-R05-02]|uniref:HpcH/HpaI aldolase/citrate lyase family protein n=1 Tax=Sphingomonas sp. BAUL-RG-20F-R05-02 TaxID=2914830 RepID=UPI001F59B64E|nr:CoA ester lyase [Sphingomonas sp. BAUL-RG-20F-R05-02]